MVFLVCFCFEGHFSRFFSLFLDFDPGLGLFSAPRYRGNSLFPAGVSLISHVLGPWQVEASGCPCPSPTPGDVGLAASPSAQALPGSAGHPLGLGFCPARSVAVGQRHAGSALGL